ncbi:MAG: type III secretion system outer membrane ring subunit SctC [Zoogloeaceae bacterium]|jgi:type III secretion protein C|nr:type III secretion system outer membrane ring subunit SctC [Zoogloeaceae bacterium]
MPNDSAPSPGPAGLPSPAGGRRDGKRPRFIWKGFFSTFLAGAFLLFSVAASGQDRQQGQGLFHTPYSHFSRQEPLAAVLMDFARTQGFSAVVSGALEGKLSGRFENVAPRAFLESLERAFDVRWYRLDGTLYFYPGKESRRALIAAPNLGDEALFQQIMALGLVSSQLPLENPQTGNGLLAVRGPPAYVAQIEAAAQALEKAADRNILRVFKLKYATADDATIESMGRSVTIPGVASILRAMVLGRDVAGSAAQTQPATVARLKGSGLTALGKSGAPGEEAGAADAAGVANAANPAGVLRIVADPRMNAVVVQDAQSRMPYYEQVIYDLDRATHLVEIHAAIVDIDSDFKRDLGVSWQGRHVKDDGYSSGLDISTDNSIAGGLPNAGALSGSGLIFSTIYTHGDNFFLARVQAMEKNGAARMLGRPSVLTADNLEASLENVTTYYISVSGSDEVDLFKVEAGTVLRVTPHIIENENAAPSIRLAVTVQDDQENAASSGIVGSMAIPPIKQTKINTQAIIDEGQSLLIGGYYFEEKQESKSGVPLLMHVPVLGHLFRSTEKNTRQMERLVLITPRIVRLGELRNLPPQVTDTDFGRAPGQADYAPPSTRTPARTALPEPDALPESGGEEAAP